MQTLLSLSIYLRRFIDTHSTTMQMETAETFINAYNAWDIDAIMGYRTPDCQHHVLPSSLGRSAKNNDEYRDYLETIMPLFSNFTVDISRL
jgi:ketosteroid isomerase-like protein